MSRPLSPSRRWLSRPRGRRTRVDPRTPPAPLYRDPVFDGAADPSLVWNDKERAWWVFYTNRRANAPDAQDGVRWCHGTDIGIASSTDGGLTWTYRGTAKGLEFEAGPQHLLGALPRRARPDISHVRRLRPGRPGRLERRPAHRPLHQPRPRRLEMRRRSSR
ncbi:MAG: hypothetical protein MZV63_13415 [Marinilabiliales bacterium]|nr:hypothetical protein [Marinilabiliales bacterium]